MNNDTSYHDDMTDDVLEERFWAKVDASGDCWEWTAALDRGYGIFNTDSRTEYAHRYSWETLVGVIPINKHLDHLCRNKRCVNPDHLEPVTNQENTKRGAAASVQRNRARRQTHCKMNHEFTEKNTHINTNGARICRECHRNRTRAFRDKRRKDNKDA
jgi:HNH endonuclease